jgi:hypothetical protein
MMPYRPRTETLLSTPYARHVSYRQDRNPSTSRSRAERRPVETQRYVVWKGGKSLSLFVPLHCRLLSSWPRRVRRMRFVDPAAHHTGGGACPKGTTTTMRLGFFFHDVVPFRRRRVDPAGRCRCCQKPSFLRWFRPSVAAFCQH